MHPETMFLHLLRRTFLQRQKKGTDKTKGGNGIDVRNSLTEPWTKKKQRSQIIPIHVEREKATKRKGKILGDARSLAYGMGTYSWNRLGEGRSRLTSDYLRGKKREKKKKSCDHKG